MNCQECQKRPATVHLTKIFNNEESVMYLCEQCAREKGEFDFSIPAPFSLQSLLTGLLNMELPSMGQVPGLQPKVQCENCGLTYAQFGQIGRFGCSSCYPTFKEKLLPLLRRIHGSTQHAGKMPQRTGNLIKARQEIDRLRQKLQASVESEEFEEAASLRDRIRELEGKLDARGGGQNA